MLSVHCWELECLCKHGPSASLTTRHLLHSEVSSFSLINISMNVLAGNCSWGSCASHGTRQTLHYCWQLLLRQLCLTQYTPNPSLLLATAPEAVVPHTVHAKPFIIASNCSWGSCASHSTRQTFHDVFSTSKELLPSSVMLIHDLIGLIILPTHPSDCCRHLSLFCLIILHSIRNKSFYGMYSLFYNLKLKYICYFKIDVHMYIF